MLEKIIIGATLISLLVTVPAMAKAGYHAFKIEWNRQHGRPSEPDRPAP